MTARLALWLSTYTLAWVAFSAYTTVVMAR